MISKEGEILTIEQFRDLLLTADANTSKFRSCANTNYTVWAQYKKNSLEADGRQIETGWMIQVDRFTKTENDLVAPLIDKALNDHDDIAILEYLIDFEKETGYFHHIWNCEVVF
jgi:hypothetical protein